MSEPQVHTFGIAKYVYAADYDILRAERDRLRDALASILIDLRQADDGNGYYSSESDTWLGHAQETLTGLLASTEGGEDE